LLLITWSAPRVAAQEGPPPEAVTPPDPQSEEPSRGGEGPEVPFRDEAGATWMKNGWSGPEPPEPPPLGSAFFGGERGRPVFGVPPPDPAKPPAPWPDLRTPGPDMGDYPNSAYTLPKGRTYIEFSPVTLSNADRENPASYNAPFLLRYGLTDDVEFRIFSNGVTHDGGKFSTTGFSPLGLDMKIHLWDDRREWLIPAVSFEGYLLTVWGSPQFNGGWQPSINLNFDLPLSKKLNLEWSVGYTGVRDAVNVVTGRRFVPRHHSLVPLIHRTNLNVNQPTVQWALEYELTERVELFFHGFHNGAILFQQGAGEMIGAGAFWVLTPGLMIFGSVNTGLTPNLPSINGQMGFVVAF
jgi:hypothetical protein